MLRKTLSNRVLAPIVLCLQVVPLLAFPPTSFTIVSQEWWLPVLLTFLVILSLVQLLARRGQAMWPWYLFSFSQGFNIISRLMLFIPHATVNVGGVQHFNTLYFIISVVTMLLSVFYLWYCELPEVRNSFLIEGRT